jgi:hypothetical protein
MLARLNRTKTNKLDKNLQNPSDQSWRAKTEQLRKPIIIQSLNSDESQNITKK